MESKPIIPGIIPGMIPIEFQITGVRPGLKQIKEESAAPPAGDSVEISTGHTTKLPRREKVEKSESPGALVSEEKPVITRTADKQPDLIGVTGAHISGSQTDPTSIAIIEDIPAADSNEDLLISQIREEFRGHPELSAVLQKYIADQAHPMNIVAYLRNPSTRDVVIQELKKMAGLGGISPQNLSEGVDLTRHAKHPLLRHNDQEFDLENCRKKTEILREKLLQESGLLYSTGDHPTQEEYLAVREHARKLRSETMPKLVGELEAVVSEIPPDQGFPTVNARTKSVDGILDKIKRMRKGNDGKSPRPGYCLADMPDAVGGRITVKTATQLRHVMQGLEKRFGKENIHKKDNFYSNPTKKYKPYRVLTYTVTVDGVPCEVQLTTLQSSLAADLWHNTGYKPIHRDLPQSTLDFLSGMQRAVTVSEHEALAADGG